MSQLKGTPALQGREDVSAPTQEEIAALIKSVDSGSADPFELVGRMADALEALAKERAQLDYCIFFKSQAEAAKRIRGRTPKLDERAKVDGIEAAAIARHLAAVLAEGQDQ